MGRLSLRVISILSIIVLRSKIVCISSPPGLGNTCVLDTLGSLATHVGLSILVSHVSLIRISPLVAKVGIISIYNQGAIPHLGGPSHPIMDGLPIQFSRYRMPCRISNTSHHKQSLAPRSSIPARKSIEPRASSRSVRPSQYNLSRFGAIGGLTETLK